MGVQKQIDELLEIDDYLTVTDRNPKLHTYIRNLLTSKIRKGLTGEKHFHFIDDIEDMDDGVDVESGKAFCQSKDEGWVDVVFHQDDHIYILSTRTGKPKDDESSADPGVVHRNPPREPDWRAHSSYPASTDPPDFGPSRGYPLADKRTSMTPTSTQMAQWMHSNPELAEAILALNHKYPDTKIEFIDELGDLQGEIICDVWLIHNSKNVTRPTAVYVCSGGFYIQASKPLQWVSTSPPL